MNKSLRGCGRESSHKDFYGFHALAVIRQLAGKWTVSLQYGATLREGKKRAAVSGGF
jgi:hypothetical protein